MLFFPVFYVLGIYRILNIIKGILRNKHSLFASFLFFCRIMVGIKIHITMNCCLLKHWILVIVLLWCCLKVAENLQPGRAQRAALSPGRAKRGWVWNQFVVPEEMTTRQHVGQVLIFWKNYGRWLFKDFMWIC